jgi:hypothetical protein
MVAALGCEEELLQRLQAALIDESKQNEARTDRSSHADGCEAFAAAQVIRPWKTERQGCARVGASSRPSST